MTKKILIFTFILLLIIPTVCFANDGGPMLDDKNLLTIEYNLESNEMEIGGTFDFTLILTNNSQYPISWVIIDKVFENDYFYSSDSSVFDTSGANLENGIESISPGEKVTYDISVTVPENIYWYETDGQYYCDFDLTLIYDANFYSEEICGETDDPSVYTWEHINPDLEPTPIRITNLSDGADLVDMQLNEKETTFYFPDYQFYELRIYDGELASELYNEVTLTNKSENALDSIHLYYQLYGSYSYETPDSLAAGESLTANILNTPFIAPEDLSDTLQADYKAIFKSGQDYYACEITKEYPAEYLTCPLVTITADSANPNLFTVANISDTDYENLYIDFSWPEYIDPDNTSLFEESQLIDVLKSGESVEVECVQGEKYSSMYLVGLLRDGKLYNWSIEAASGETLYREYYLPFYYYLSDVAPDYYAALEESATEPTSEPAVEVTASPTDAVNSSDESEADREEIQVTEISRQSSIPFWVWFVLAAAIIAGAVLIIVFRKKKSDDDKLKYE